MSIFQEKRSANNKKRMKMLSDEKESFLFLNQLLHLKELDLHFLG